MRVLRRISKIISGIGGFLMLAFAFLRWETDIAGIPGSLSEQLAFVRALPGGTVPIIVYTAIGVALVLLAIGPHRVQAWIQLASPDRSTTDAVPSTAETGAGVGVYREAVGETYRDPLQVEEETDEEFLRRRCQELAQRLFSFLEEQGYSRHEATNDPEIERRDDKALAIYNRGSLGPETRNLLRKLEERGLNRPQELKSFERQALAKPLSLFAVERIANLLNEIGHDW